VLALAAALVAAGGCGSSKPDYCSTRSDLQRSIEGLTNLTPSSGLSGVQAQLKQIQSEANTLVAQAKSDFPSQTSAIRSSVNTVVSAVRALPSNPSASQIATVANDALAVVNSVRRFVDDSSSKCD
jgi:hypothetical protein